MIIECCDENWWGGSFFWGGGLGRRGGNSHRPRQVSDDDGDISNFQVTQETTNILRHFGYVFEQRGLIAVKGKGELMTYYLIGKGDKSKNVPAKVKGSEEDSAT